MEKRLLNLSATISSPFLSSIIMLHRCRHLRRFFSTTANSEIDPVTSQKLRNDALHLSNFLIAQHNPYHPLESSIQLIGTLNITPTLTYETLTHLQHHSKIALAFFQFTKTNYSGSLNHEAYTLIVDIMGRVRQFDVAWQLVMEMSGLGLEVGFGVFKSLIRRYVAAGFTRLAVRCFDDMEGFIGREGDEDEFRFLLDTLCKYGYPKVATELFNKRKSKYEPNEKSYTILIYGWSKVNQHAMAKKFLNEMVDKGIEPNIVTYNVLLNGICRYASLHPDTRFDRTIRASEDLLKEMHSRGIEPDVTSYSIILHVYSRAHKPELTLTKFNSMKERGISPTIATYTSVVKCLVSCGRIEDAEKLLDDMSLDNIQPSPATYNCFFKEYKGREDVNSAMKLYKKMKEPDIRTYNILVGMFAQLDKMSLVHELWNDMKENGVGPDLDTYTLLIHGLCEKQKWRRACEYFMEMIEKGFLPQKITFETLYKGLIQADMLRTWRRLKKKVDEESVKFGAEFQNYHLKPYKR